MEDIQKALQEFRNQIDTIDKELVYLLSRRFELVSSVWDLKKMVNMQTLQPNRWNEVLKKIKDYSEEYWVNPNFTNEIWELIHKEALSIENNK